MKLCKNEPKKQKGEGELIPHYSETIGFILF